MPIEPGTVNAPDFPTDLEWINTDRPLSMKDLRGKIVLLDFWTYCCINCMHVLPELKRLEEKHGDYLAVVGVHSAKFEAEKSTANIRQAVMRYGIEHPVVNDRDMRLWSEYAARAWPTLMLIDPLGKVFGTHSGEGIFDLFDGVITQMAEHYEAEGKLVRGPIDLALERDRRPASLLSFPGKVLADDEGDRLFIADSNHQRIVIASLTTGGVLDTVGSGEAGFADGDFSEARFRNPQGMAVEGDLLYVADTDNHAVRRVDLRSRTVVTLAGTGGQADDFDSRPGPARGRALNSPWDLELAHGVLFIAMAGSHQIWGLDLDEHYIAGHAGSGREDHVDGPLLAAALAQPSGLTKDDRHLFVADSEVSSVRAVDLDPRGGHVKTVMGAGLFDFGDVDGPPDQARLQHPLDVEYDEGVLFVADTYNNKIKAIGLHTRSTRTFAGTGEAGLADGALEEAQFDEPGGLSAARGKLYVADTNNHAIRVIDAAERTVTTFELKDPHKLARRRPEVRKLGSVAPGSLEVVAVLPDGTRLTPGADSQIEAAQGGELQVFAWEGRPIRFDVAEGSPLRIETAVYYCEDGKAGPCWYDMTMYEAEVSANGASRLEIRIGPEA